MVKVASSIKEEVITNVEHAQEKKKQQYNKRKMYGVKVLKFKVGDQHIKNEP